MLVFVVLILSGVILWYLNLQERRETPRLSPSGSDEASAIETDLQAVDLEGLDSESKDIETELAQ